MDELEAWETVLPGGDDRTSKNYHQWKSAVLKIRDMAEYKLYKLFRMGFSVADIEADKHWSVYPPDRETRKRKALGRLEDQKRGRRLSLKKKQWLYARALRAVADGILAFHSLDEKMRVETKAERDGFDELVKKFSHKA